MDAYQMLLLHDAEETAARELAVWDALAVHVGGSVVAWHRGAAAYQLDRIHAAQVSHLAVGALAGAAAALGDPVAELGSAFRNATPLVTAAAGGVVASLLANRIDVHTGERPVGARETPW